MKNKTLYVISILFVCILLSLTIGITHVQATELPTDRFLYGGSGVDTFSKVISTTDGGYIVIGDFTSTDIPGLENKGEKDIVLMKYDANDNIVWQTTYGGDKTDSVLDVIATTDGGIVLVGNSNSTNLDGITPKGSDDAIIVKYDASGTMQWHNSCGGSDREDFRSVVETEDGGFITVGLIWSTDIDGITHNGNNDGIIVKYDNQGNAVWKKGFGGSNYDYLHTIIKTSSTTYVALAFSNSTDIDGLTSNGDSDAIMVQYDDDGNILWQKNYGGSNSDRFINGIPTSDGGYIVVGDTMSTDIDGISNDGWHRGIIVKYDATGTIQWQKGHATNIFHKVMSTADGGYIVYGLLSSAESGGYDAVIVKYDATGNVEWEKEHIDECKTMVEWKDMLLEKDAVVLVGTKLSNHKTAEQGGIPGAFMMKYDLNGKELWRSSLGNTDEDSLSSVIQLGDMYIAVGTLNQDGLILEATDTYEIAVSSAENGTIYVDTNIAKVGSTVSFQLTPDAGYVLDKFRVIDALGIYVEVIKNADMYTFVMPTASVTITASFEKELPPSGGQGTDTDGTTPGDENNTPSENTQNQTNPPSNVLDKDGNADNPKTGDNLFAYVATSLFSIIGIVLLSIIIKKQKI